MKPFIILTCPHCTCDIKSRERDCDLVAGNASSSLLSLITYDKKLIFSDVFRDKLDLNRINAIHSNFWTNNLIPTILDVKKSYYPIFLLDIHSFPNGYDISKFDVFFIDNGGDQYYIKLLLDVFESYNIPTEVKHDIPVISIVNKALDEGLISILIEFDEKITESSLININKAINSWINKISSFNF